MGLICSNTIECPPHYEDRFKIPERIKVSINARGEEPGFPTGRALVETSPGKAMEYTRENTRQVIDYSTGFEHEIVPWAHVERTPAPDGPNFKGHNQNKWMKLYFGEDFGDRYHTGAAAGGSAAYAERQAHPMAYLCGGNYQGKYWYEDVKDALQKRIGVCEPPPAVRGNDPVMGEIRTN